jgi:hypothetical protein
MAARRRQRAAVVLAAAPSSILDFESFVESLPFLSPGERDRILVAGGEMLDNVIKHGSPLRWGRVVAGISRPRGSPSGIVLTFRFSARGFAAFARESGKHLSAPPRFDAEHRRWRGFGLVMCRNIARRIVLRPGLLADRIIVEFDSEE